MTWVVSAHIREPLIGAEWLGQEKALWNFATRRLWLNGEVKVIQKSSAASCNAISINCLTAASLAPRPVIEAGATAKNRRWMKKTPSLLGKPKPNRQIRPSHS